VFFLFSNFLILWSKVWCNLQSGGGWARTTKKAASRWCAILSPMPILFSRPLFFFPTFFFITLLLDVVSIHALYLRVRREEPRMNENEGGRRHAKMGGLHGWLAGRPALLWPARIGNHNISRG
jgi:hypothetical protein